MPTRQNRYFNNPQMAGAFSNLAGLFAPPSAQDFYMQSRTEGQDYQNEAQRRAFEAMVAEGVTPQDQDRFGLAMTTFGQGYGPTSSNRAVDIASADRRYGVDVGAQNALDVQGLRNQQSGREAAFGAAINPQGRQGISDEDIMATLGINVPGFSTEGPVAPTDAQVMGGETRRLIDSGQITDDMLVGQAFGNTPVETIVGPDGQPTITTRPQALGQTPVQEQGNVSYDNYVVLNPETMETEPQAGRTLPDGRILAPNGEDITNRVVAKTSTSGGTSFEVGPDGQIRFSMGGGITNKTAGALEGSREGALQLANSMTSLYRNLTPEALGVAGQFNDEFMNRVVAQVAPNAANLPVAAQRTQLRAAIVREARGILGNDRLNREDRERIAQLMPDPNTIFESYPRAKAALATLATYAAYDAAFADARREGETLQPINPQIVGQLVDQGMLDPAIAQDAISSLFGGARSVPGSGAPSAPAPEQSAQRVDPQTALQQAQQAIAAGADRAAVIERLQSLGIDAGGLQ